MWVSISFAHTVKLRNLRLYLHSVLAYYYKKLNYSFCVSSTWFCLQVNRKTKSFTKKNTCFALTLFDLSLEINRLRKFDFQAPA